MGPDGNARPPRRPRPRGRARRGRAGSGRGALPLRHRPAALPHARGRHGPRGPRHHDGGRDAGPDDRHPAGAHRPSHRRRRRLSSRLPDLERADPVLRRGEGQGHRRVAGMDSVRRRDDRRAAVAGRADRRAHAAAMTPLRAVTLAVLAVVAGVAPAAAHHTGVYTPKDNAISANFKQLKFSLQAGRFDVALRLYDEGALRAEMRARAAALPAGLEARTRAALAAHDAGEAERRLMLFFVALARDLAREADRRPHAAPALAQSKVVKIGDLGSKVGVFEGYGKYQTMGMQLAVDELNARGGVLGHKVEIVSEDDETKPAPAVRKAEKLILQDDVKLLVGAVSSGATMAVMDVTKKHKTIHWNSVSCAEFMRTTKFHKYYFSNQPDSRMQANGLAKYIVDKMGKRVYIFYTDYAMGQSDGRQFKTALEKLGGEVVGVAGAPLDTKDFSPWFGAINQAAPEVLFLAFAGTDSLRLMTQLHSFGMTRKYKLAGIDCFLLQQDLPSIAEPMEGFVQLNHFSAYNPDKSMQAFNAKFRKRFGVDANIAAGAYDAVHFWAAAVEKAASFDPDRVAEAHEGMCREETHIGRQCIRKEDHQVVMDMHLYQVKGGKNIPIARIAGTDSIGEPMVGKDPVEGFTWELKKKN